MAKCDLCGEHENMPYSCRHCGGTYCAEHRLPENHDCPGLNQWNDPKGVFDSGFDDSVNEQGGGADGIVSRLGIDTGPGGVLAYFRGNMTFVFLGLMWITFAAQLIFQAVTGYNPAAPFLTPEAARLYRSIFTLTTAHPEYVWTWVVSIFAHGGFIHIAFNSIVIYFFGRLLEQYVGTKEFTILFIVSGVLAGLGQVALGLFQSQPMAVLGASGAGLAIMGGLTVLNPDIQVYIWGILPVPIWALTGFYAIVSVLGIVGPSALGGNVANGAHLIGLAVGLAYGQYVKRRGMALPNELRFGGGRGPGGPGGPGGRRRF